MGPVLVTGIGGPAGRSVVKYFKDLAYPVIGTDIRRVDIEVDRFYIVPPASEHTFHRALLDIIKRERPSLFVPTVSEELTTVSRSKGEIEGQGCTVYISNPEAVEIASDKFETARFLYEKGIDVPLTFGESTSKDVIIKRLGFPMLAKPRYGRGARGVTIYWQAEELYNENRKGLVFQEFIQGDEYDVNLFIDRRSTVLASIVLKKTELENGIVGNALKVERVDIDSIARTCVRAARLLHMEGPLDFDIRMRNYSTPVILEINARVGGNVLHSIEVLDSLRISWERENTSRCLK